MNATRARFACGVPGRRSAGLGGLRYSGVGAALGWGPAVGVWGRENDRPGPGDWPIVWAGQREAAFLKMDDFRLAAWLAWMTPLLAALSSRRAATRACS